MCDFTHDEPMNALDEFLTVSNFFGENSCPLAEIQKAEMPFTNINIEVEDNG
jgi:hypothetical protein